MIETFWIVFSIVFTGGCVTSAITKDNEYFGYSVLLCLLMGFGKLLVSSYGS